MADNNAVFVLQFKAYDNAIIRKIQNRLMLVAAINTAVCLDGTSPKRARNFDSLEIQLDVNNGHYLVYCSQH